MICKKINKKVEIKSTNDDIPNLGYGLTAKKYKKPDLSSCTTSSTH